MPPKRIKAVDQDDNIANKKQKTDSSPTLSTTVSSAIIDDKQVCWYDGNCKQKNPAHWSSYKYEINFLGKTKLIILFAHP